MEVYVEKSTLEEPSVIEDEEFKPIRSQFCFKEGKCTMFMNKVVFCFLITDIGMFVNNSVTIYIAVWVLFRRFSFEISSCERMLT